MVISLLILPCLHLRVVWGQVDSASGQYTFHCFQSKKAFLGNRITDDGTKIKNVKPFNTITYLFNVFYIVCVIMIDYNMLHHVM